ncbi:DUF502 domain-containing protein [Natronomonas marina]|jgi:uncharacterized membrane protein|uniref:DUF502 domain-containing protein n=1 Tax=Natronomonas marina TaxID=2961939 RepID=UPI0020C9CB37|nr:DUF502 domain-containing protein [Natronomonas marina]
MNDPFIDDRTTRQQLKSYFVTGAVLVVPTLLTVGIAAFVLQFLSGYLAPVSSTIETYTGVGGTPADLLTLVLALAVVVLLGAAVETAPRGSVAAEYFHGAVETIPGVGDVYGGFREMSETVANGEESFRDVKLVEYPSEGSYTMAFVTADAPDHLERSVDHDEEGMMSLFLPMGPNPVMGGFVIYVSRDRVHDIDVGVDEGLQAIITSGVTISDDDDPTIGERMQQRIEEA